MSIVFNLFLIYGSFGHWNFEFIWNLVLVIWNFISGGRVSPPKGGTNPPLRLVDILKLTPDPLS